jgi:hypothetical protein
VATEHAVLEHESMRTWAPLLLSLLFRCAFAETPNGNSEVPAEASGDDDAGSGGELASGNTPPSGDELAATPAPDSTDAAANGPATEADAAAENAILPPIATPPFDPGEGGVCMGAPSPGDLVIDELMIESVAGAGDHGEWLEVASTLACALDLRGLRGDAPSGNKIRTFTIGDDVWIPAFGTFVVADSSSAAINHDLPGTMIAWSGQPGDVLRNKGGTATLQMNGVLIDSVTYPSMTLTAGASLAFPSDCAPSRRSDWNAWQTSTRSWFPGFYGTPNAPNADVQCP